MSRFDSVIVVDIEEEEEEEAPKAPFLVMSAKERSERHDKAKAKCHAMYRKYGWRYCNWCGEELA